LGWILETAFIWVRRVPILNH